ncbi:MAG TPA: imelysin family protein [Chitinophagaceae bacterium]|jgi:hypothetical protein
MKRIVLLLSAGFTVLFLSISFSCSKSNSGGGDTPKATGPDSTLINLGTNIIIPSYQKLASSASALDAAVIAFNALPSSTSLASVQAAFKDAYKSWEACSGFEFGPASDLSLTTHFTNSFPTDTTIIKANIAGTPYVIDALANYPAQGFPAMDFLLFANGNDASLARFNTDANAVGAHLYLAALSASLKTKTAAVSAAWAVSGGNYYTKFINATGVDAGSSLSQLVNSYVLDFDVNLQNYKIGIPIGLYGPSVLPKAPTKVEGYYSGLSVQLLLAQVQSMQNIYLGGSGPGIDDKVAATKALYNGGSLDLAIQNEMTTLLAKIQALPDPLSTGIQNNSTAITDCYTEVRKLTVLLKADMTSALGIKISFADDDGD